MLKYWKIRTHGNLTLRAFTLLFHHVGVDVCLMESNSLLVRSDRYRYQICDEQRRSDNWEQFCGAELDWRAREEDGIRVFFINIQELGVF